MRYQVPLRARNIKKQKRQRQKKNKRTHKYRRITTSFMRRLEGAHVYVCVDACSRRTSRAPEGGGSSTRPSVRRSTEFNGEKCTQKPLIRVCAGVYAMLLATNEFGWHEQVSFTFSVFASKSAVIGLNVRWYFVCQLLYSVSH